MGIGEKQNRMKAIRIQQRTTEKQVGAQLKRIRTYFQRNTFPCIDPSISLCFLFIEFLAYLEIDFPKKIIWKINPETFELLNEFLWVSKNLMGKIITVRLWRDNSFPSSPKRKRIWKQQPTVLFYKRCPSSDIPISLLKMKSAFQTVARSMQCELPTE